MQIVLMLLSKLTPLLDFFKGLFTKKFSKISHSDNPEHIDQNADTIQGGIGNALKAAQAAAKAATPVYMKPSAGSITCPYGNRVLYFDGKPFPNFHCGVDLSGERDIIAPEDIVIEKVLAPDAEYPAVFGWNKAKGEWDTIAPKGRAWTPFIWAHGVFSGVQYVFKHVRASVKPGDTIKAGTVIARSGQLGFSQGPHLHFEVWPTPKSSVDPVKWFAAKGVVF